MNHGCDWKWCNGQDTCEPALAKSWWFRRLSFNFFINVNTQWIEKRKELAQSIHPHQHWLRSTNSLQSLARLTDNNLRFIGLRLSLLLLMICDFLGTWFALSPTKSQVILFNFWHCRQTRQTKTKTAIKNFRVVSELLTWVALKISNQFICSRSKSWEILEYRSVNRQLSLDHENDNCSLRHTC